MSSGIQLQEKNTLGEIYKSELGTFTNTGWKPAAGLEQEKWADAIYTFERGRRAFPWFIGDGLVWGFSKWGEMYNDLANELGLKYQTLANYKWVAKSVDPSVRNENLEWEHHKIVASRSKEEQIQWLTLAEESGWSSYELKRAIGGSKVMLIGDLTTASRTKRKLLTEFFSLAFAGKDTVDKWIEELSREEINRLTDGEIQEGLTRLSTVIEILHLY